MFLEKVDSEQSFHSSYSSLCSEENKGNAAKKRLHFHHNGGISKSKTLCVRDHIDKP